MIDSNLAVWAVLPVVAQLDTAQHLARWRRDAIRLCAPTLWVAESVSAIRAAVHARLILVEEGRTAVDDLFALQIETLPMSSHLSRSAFEWAGRLQQMRAYDGFYLALAEELGAEFWTADQRLVNRARQVGAVWAHWIGEAEEAP